MGVIDRIVVENFKNLRKVDLALGRMNLFIGANASGKSNFLDALRVLQGIGNDFTISEILDGKPKSATSEVWDGIRGGSATALPLGADGTSAVTIEVRGRLKGNSKNTPRKWEFRISFLPNLGVITYERFRVGEVIYGGDPREYVCYYSGRPGRPPHFSVGSTRAVLRRLSRSPYYYCQEDHVDLAGRVVTLLANAQRVDPMTALRRSYSRVHHVQRMGDHGENFAALVNTLCQNEKARDSYLSWLRQLRPEEIEIVGVLRGAVSEPMFMLRENGRDFPAPVLSDGTLRFAALAAAFFQPDMPDLMTIEEIENGIHASRLRLLLELLRSQAEAAKTQIVATTHSATVLDWLREDEYKTTFFCKRDESTGESKICALADVPHFMDVVKKRPVSELFSEGWLEAAL